METPEIHPPHVPEHKPRGRREGLPRWLELTIAVTALITSVSSIVIAIQHGHVMEKLVEANSIPYLEGGFSTATPEGANVISLDLVNRGVGPAHEESLRVTVDKQPVRSFREFVLASLGAKEGPKAYETFHQTHTLIVNDVPRRFIPAGQLQFIFKVPRTPENAPVWDLLYKQQSRWNVGFCYCSVFDECWAAPSEFEEVKRVKQCVRDDRLEFAPLGERFR
jgi:hypothetical protein